MSKNNLELERHNIYLSRQVWGELKLHAFLEGRTASEVVNDMVRDFLSQQLKSMQTPGHRSHNPDDRRLGRTVHFESELWQELQELAQTEKFSIAALIEELLIDILGLAEDNDIGELPAGLGQNRHVVGNDIYMIDADPKIIDVNTRQPVQETPGKDT